MDEFGWGNTRVVLDEGKNKKVVNDANEMKFNESMIPYKKWSGQWRLLTIDWRASDCACRVRGRDLWGCHVWQFIQC